MSIRGRRGFRVGRVVVVGVAAVLLAGCASAGSDQVPNDALIKDGRLAIPGFTGGSGGSGSRPSPAALPSATGPPAGTVAWTQDLKATGKITGDLAGAVADRGTVYVHSFSNVVALSAATGVVKWTVKIDNLGLSVADGAVFVWGTDTGVSSLNPATGGVLWNIKVPSVPDTPAVIDGVLAVRDDHGQLVGYDVKTGKKAWTVPEATLDSLGEVGADASAFYAVGDRDNGGSNDAVLVALNPKSGAVLWSIKVADSLQYDSSEVTYTADGKVIVSSGDDAITLLAYDAITHEQAWTATVPTTSGTGAGWPPIIDNTAIYSNRSSVIGVSLATGKQAFTHAANFGSVLQFPGVCNGDPCWISNGSLYVSDIRGTVATTNPIPAGTSTDYIRPAAISDGRTFLYTPTSVYGIR